MGLKVIYAVLDWGLGHATRSIPVIDGLHKIGHHVDIVSHGNALSFLRRHYPEMSFHRMPDREVTYGESGAFLSLISRALRQPEINSNQRNYFKTLAERLEADIIISDNVYGAHVNGVKSILITHQLSLNLPFGNRLINARLASWINQFDEVWIPDDAAIGLSGNLSTSSRVNVKKRHLGILSRFSKTEISADYAYAAILGGPEPQRSIFERKVAEAFSRLEGEKIVFRGSDVALPRDQEGISWISFGDGESMAKAISASQIVVARSGYSSLSDLLVLKARALVVPTPGQTEQKYLAQRVHEKNWFATCHQAELTAEKILKAKSKAFHQVFPKRSELEKVLNSL